MKIALELNATECLVLIELLGNKIAEAEDCRESHEEYWSTTDDDVLAYKIKLRNKIQEFSDLQETLDEED